jgi:hypothetical protein
MVIDRLPAAKATRVLDEILDAKSEKDFSDETREVIKQGRREMAERGVTLS